MVLFTIERVFQKAFKAGSHLEKFYGLLIRENIFDLHIDTEDVRAPSNDDFDGGREAIELRLHFQGSKSYFLSYLFRTLLEITVASILLLYMRWKGLPVLKHSN